MIEIVSPCHFDARRRAVEKNGGRACYLVACFRRTEGDDALRFVFRTSSAGGAS